MKTKSKIKNKDKDTRHAVRPWGEFYGLHEGAGWYLKTIHVAAGKRLSLQYHHKREECWLLVEGDATATRRDSKGADRTYKLKKGVLFKVPRKAVHRLESKKGGVIVEVAYGNFDENDIVRIQDDHGRA